MKNSHSIKARRLNAPKHKTVKKMDDDKGIILFVIFCSPNFGLRYSAIFKSKSQKTLKNMDEAMAQGKRCIRSIFQYPPRTATSENFRKYLRMNTHTLSRAIIILSLKNRVSV